MQTHQIVTAQPAMGKLAQMDLPMGVSYRLLRLLKDTGEIVELFNKKQRELFEQYGNQEDDKIVIPDENQEEFNEKMTSLLNEEIDLEFTPINVDAFADDVKLTIPEINSLEWMLTDG